MKISITDLKKAIQWVEINSNDTHVSLVELQNFILIECKDKYESLVDIRLYSDGQMLPKIRKESLLK